MADVEIFYEDEFTKIIQGDIIDALRSPGMIPDNIQMAMTSVPYWRVRLYTDDAWGFESNWNDWVDKMVALGTWMKFKVRSDGSIFLNIGDKYGGSSPGSDYGDKRYVERPTGLNTEGSRKRSTIKDKVNRKGNLMLLPERVAIAWTDECDYTLLNKIIWHKPGYIMQSYDDKFTSTWEPIYFFVKDPEKHKFSRERIGVEKRDGRVAPKMLVKAEQKRVFGEQSGLFGVDEIDYNPIVAPKTEAEFEHWYENERAKVSWHDHSDDASQGQRHDSNRTAAVQHPSGSNPGDMWSVTVSHDDFFKEEGQRASRTWPAWPIDLPVLPILATTDAGDTVFDHFGGSGSLGVAAKILGRKSVLVDIEPESCEKAASRIIEAKVNPAALRSK